MARNLSEVRRRIIGDGKPHLVRLTQFVGHTWLCMAPPQQAYRLILPKKKTLSKSR